MKWCRILAGVLLPLLPVFGGAPAGASDNLCVSAVKGEGGFGGGLATGELADQVILRLCDGGRARLELRGGTPHAVELLETAAAGSDIELSDKIPHGEVSFGQEAVRRAWLTGPTTRYNHAILGDAVEASGFRLLSTERGELAFTLGPDSVFEDLRVRLVDLNGDGREELIVIRSYLEAGAALAVYGLSDGAILPLGETPAIGTANRWLNPAGAADFDGDGDIEIAYVETPHIGGILRFVSLTPEGLVEEQALRGFSNHAIGSRELDQAAVVDWDGNGVLDLALPDAARKGLQIVSLADGKAKVIAGHPETGARHAARITTAVVGSDLDGDGKPEVVYALEDGTLVIARP